MRITTLLPLDHPSITLAEAVKAFTQDFLDHYSLSYFQYFRYNADGSVWFLVNYLDYILDYLESGIPIMTPYHESYKNQLTYCIFRDEDTLSPNPGIAMAREKYGFYYPITLVKRYKYFYDAITFASAGPRVSPYSYYLNHLGQFENFINQFIQQNSDLIQVTNKHIIQLPLHMRNPQADAICIGNLPKRYTVEGRDAPTYITHQELTILSLLKEGLRYKDIAIRLALSPRTVETHVTNVKIRTAFQSRQDVLNILKRI